MSGTTTTQSSKSNESSVICSKKNIIKCVSLILAEIIEENDLNNEEEEEEVEKNTVNNNSKLFLNLESLFKSSKIPEISIEKFIERLAKYTLIEESTLIISLMYIDRYCDCSKNKLSMFNIHRLLIISVLLSIKFNEDENFSNEHYCKVGGIKVEEMIALELEYLKSIEWNIFVKSEDYEIYVNHLNDYHKIMEQNTKF
jgi:hypothetical protein